MAGEKMAEEKTVVPGITLPQHCTHKWGSRHVKWQEYICDHNGTDKEFRCV
jgi:hypothetical protein